MKPARLTSLLFLASLTMSLHTAIFAADHTESDEQSSVSLETGQALPVLDIEEGGEIFVRNNTVVKTPWSSTAFESKGKVQLVQYVAANRGAARQNKAFTDSLIEKRFTAEQLSTTVIVQMADTLPLLKGLVVSKLKKNKVKHETINFVVDDIGVGLQRWGMKNKSYAVIVLDENGKILFVKDGPLSDREIKTAIRLMENQMT